MSQKSLTTGELARFLDKFLNVETVQDKYTKNGLTVCSSPRKQVKKIGFAVDANIETFEKARINNCDFLIVHHGLFFGNFQDVTNENYNRIRYLIDHNISLYSVHIPLDVHPTVGNNATLAKMIDADPVGFFSYGLYAKIRKSLRKAKSIEDIKKTYDLIFSENSKLFDFTSTQHYTEGVENVLICSGGGASILKEYLAKPYMTLGQLNRSAYGNKNNEKKNDEKNQNDKSSMIILQKPDLFITGEQDHSIYSLAKETNISLLFLGHYLSETTGVKSLMPIVEKKFRDFKAEVKFIEARTGL
jgi:dinuclear metal center YbgI/SA1388 family protein